MTNCSRSQGPDWGYLAREATLVLLIGYTILAGGTFNGIVLSRVQSINTLLLGLVGVAWLGVRIARHVPFPRTAVDLPLLLFLLAHVLSTALSVDPRRSAGAVWRLGLYALAFYLFVDLFRRGWPAELFIKVLIIIGAVVLGFSLLHVAGWYASWRETSGSTGILPPTIVRARSIIGSPNWLAAFVNLVLPFALLRLLKAESWPARLLSLTWLWVAGIVIGFTASRGGWLGTMATLGTMAILSRGVREHVRSLLHWAKARRSHAMVGAVAALVTLALIVALAFWQVPRVLNRRGLASRLHFWQAAGVAWRTSPLSGTGPLTYGETYLQTHTVPHEPLYTHAHSYPINLAAETGILGIGALVWLTIAIAGDSCQSWRRASADERPLYAAAMAALIGCAVHSQFDTVQRLPLINLILALQLSILLARPECRRRNAGGLRWALPVSWGLLFAVAIWWSVPSTLFSRGITAASKGHWREASALIDRAAKRDPNHAYYDLQAGYAHGIRAEQAPHHLAEAIASYEVGIQRSPNYALNWLNLGALYRQAGEEREALTCLDRGLKLAPNWGVVHLNLGQLFEQLGRQDEAVDHFRQALDGIPDWAHAYFWRTTTCRTHAHDSWLEAESAREPASAPGGAELWYRTGQRALEVEDYAQALEAFGRALDLKPLVRFYVAKASALEALGRYGEAEETLRTGGLAGAGGRMERARARFALARLHHTRGEIERAIRTALGAVETARDPVTHLAGDPGHIEYAHYLFHAPPLPEALLPQVTIITVTDEVARWMLELGGWYEEKGNVDEAARLYRELLEAVPDANEARARLEALGLTVPD